MLAPYKAVVRRWFDEVMEKGNLDFIDELFGEAYLFRMPGVTATNPEGLRELATSYRTAFRDLQFTNFDQMPMAIGSSRGGSREARTAALLTGLRQPVIRSR